MQSNVKKQLQQQQLFKFFVLNNLTDPYFCETCKRLTLLLPKIESWALKEVFSICFCSCSSCILYFYFSFSSFFLKRARTLCYEATVTVGSRRSAIMILLLLLLFWLLLKRMFCCCYFCCC